MVQGVGSGHPAPAHGVLFYVIQSEPHTCEVTQTKKLCIRGLRVTTVNFSMFIIYIILRSNVFLGG